VILMRGYSQFIIEANENAERSLGVDLGALCINKRYPVTKVAEKLSMSRQGIYDWFTGKSKPAKSKEELIKSIMREINEL